MTLNVMHSNDQNKFLTSQNYSIMKLDWAYKFSLLAQTKWRLWHSWKPYSIKLRITLTITIMTVSFHL